jgi:hypothetical protein
MRSRRRDEVFFLGLLGVVVPKRVRDVVVVVAMLEGAGDGGHFAAAAAIVVLVALGSLLLLQEEEFLVAGAVLVGDFSVFDVDGSGCGPSSSPLLSS